MSLNKPEFQPKTAHRDEVRMQYQMEESGFNALQNQGALSAQEAIELAEEAAHGTIDFEGGMSPEEARAELKAQMAAQAQEVEQPTAMEIALKQAMER